MKIFTKIYKRLLKKAMFIMKINTKGRKIRLTIA